MSKTSLLIFISLLFISGVSFAQEPSNIAFLKQDIIKYHDSGEYEYDISKTTTSAEEYITQRISEPDAAKKKLAIVLDIDDTALTAYPHWSQLGFGGTMNEIEGALKLADAEAIPETLHLFNFAKQHNVKVFFITGRDTTWQKLTINNLTKAGYKNWDGLVLRPASDKVVHKSVIPFKSSMRKQLVDQGYDIILSMGDQYSDLNGGYADRLYKLPNPFYYLP